MAVECSVRQQPAQPTLSVRLTISIQRLPQEIGRVYGAIAGYLAQRGQPPAGAPFVAYYNMDMQQLDVVIGFPTATPLPGRGEIQAGEIPGGRQAICLHVGPYDQIEPAYGALSQYIQAQGHTPTGIAYEFYLNDPMQTPPAELQTLVAFPLRD